ncbi:MAG TPA: CRISPR system precrRNA processing endoribonuclease RAMP protein Cas6 [Ktedonobacteraceae bacterium]|nr:CRISPR system precrRNA processing endoribonuclease RAMP protein Cas6 [Ktedonobacteraceae bacterium]
MHQGQKQRLFTCSSLHLNQPAHTRRKAERENIPLPLDPKETYLLRITLLLGELFPLLHEALTSFDNAHVRLEAPPFLRLGKQFFLLEEVIITNDDPGGWTGFTSLANLVERASKTTGNRLNTLTLDFASLTTFNRGNRSIPYATYPLLLPLPQFVFANLARRWQEIAPPNLVGVVQSEHLEQYLQEEGVIIVDYDLRPHRLHFSTHQQRGFVGTCTYQLRGPVEPITPVAMKKLIPML